MGRKITMSTNKSNQTIMTVPSAIADSLCFEQSQKAEMSVIDNNRILITIIR